MLELFIGLSVAIGANLYVAARNQPRARLRRRLKRAAATPIADATEGAVVRVEGTAQADGEVLVAPVSLRPCVAWRLTVERRSGGGWVAAGQAEQLGPFLLHDGVQVARVRAPMQLMLRADVVQEAAYLPKAVLARFGVNETSLRRSDGEKLTRVPFLCKGRGVRGALRHHRSVAHGLGKYDVAVESNLAQG